MNRVLTTATAFSMLALASLTAQAQEYPVKSIRMVLPFPAGGGSDLIARVTAQNRHVNFRESAAGWLHRAILQFVAGDCAGDLQQAAV